MAKTNFSQAEENFDEQLDKIKLKGWLQEADIAQGKPENPLFKERKKQLILLEMHLNSLFKKERDFYDTLPLKRKEIAPLQQKLKEWTEEETEKVEQCLKNIASFQKTAQKTSLESQIELEKNQHLTKRFNVNDKWLPLK